MAKRTYVGLDHVDKIRREFLKATTRTEMALGSEYPTLQAMDAMEAILHLKAVLEHAQDLLELLTPMATVEAPEGA